MKNRSLFLFMVIVFIIAPAIHYFIAGEHADNSSTRNILVVIQAVVGTVLVLIYGRKSKEEKAN